MNLQHVNCNLCGADDTKIITVQSNHNVVRCKKCSLVYVNPRPNTKHLIHLYETYHQRNGKKEYTWARLMEKNYRDVSGFLAQVFPGKGKILDIGCGYGHFLETMRTLGWVVSGIDPSPNTVCAANKKNLNVIETSIEDVSFPEASFDAITAFYVLEHLPDPYSAVKKIHSLLKPGGIFVLRVPHTTPIVRLLSLFHIKNNLYDTPYHLYDFSPETITVLLKKAGFTTVQVKPGTPTLPVNFLEKIVSITSGNIARIFFAVSGGKFLFPGTSKTTIAYKNLTE